MSAFAFSVTTDLHGADEVIAHLERAIGHARLPLPPYSHASNKEYRAQVREESAVMRLGGGRGRKLLLHFYGVERPPEQGGFSQVVGLEWTSPGFTFHVETCVEDAELLLAAFWQGRADASPKKPLHPGSV